MRPAILAAGLAFVFALSASAGAQVPGGSETIRGRCETFVVAGLNRLSACPNAIAIYRNFTLTDLGNRALKRPGVAIEIPTPANTIRLIGYRDQPRATSKMDAIGDAGGKGFKIPIQQVQLVIDGDVTEESASGLYCEMGVVSGRKLIHCYQSNAAARGKWTFTFLPD